MMFILSQWSDKNRRFHALYSITFAITSLEKALAPVSLSDVLLVGKRVMSRSRLNTYKSNTHKKRPSTAALLEQPSLAGGLS